MPSKEHWNDVYSRKASNTVSWFQPRASVSLELIHKAGVGTSAKIIDVGGGTSTLIDDLICEGHSELTVLDLSVQALAVARSRLGDKADAVTWLEADITKVQLADSTYDLWHDRAVFHFLISPEDRNAYVRTVERSVKPGGAVIIATFAEDGPEKCSGLPVMRYSTERLHDEFGVSFALVEHATEEHQTPSGAMQSFVYCLLRKKS
ncbi:class I SAM-dependent methyltransferase [Dyella soli]|uniref:Class I SAM-dependent methyltransferase n=1 Tax=Dyella soli TaxID=522319 RepID=A0A4V2NL49_9GAMM|nr:class I SAM-dependent methyltransferase [Dyella soli]